MCVCVRVYILTRPLYLTGYALPVLSLGVCVFVCVCLQLASQLPSLRTQVSQLRDTLTIVTVLQSEAAALQQQLDAAGDVGALQTHVATLRSDAECVEELRREMCEITPLAEEAQILQEQIKVCV